MATITDVARKAGVSTATVSHVINKTRFVSQETTDRVLAAMEELGYRGNTLASSLRTGRTNTIGVLVTDSSNQFHAEIARVIEDVVFKKGYSVYLCNSDNDIGKERIYIDTMLARQVDGVIYNASGESHDHLLELIEHNIPVVVVGRAYAKYRLDSILIDNEKGGRMAASYLIGLGHRRIACITGPSATTPSAARVVGFLKVLKDAGIEMPEEYIAHGDFRTISGEETMTRFLSLSPRPTAVFACNDLMAIGALRSLQMAGINAPTDISVIGFDNIQMAASTAPGLTTIAQPIKEMGKLAANRLINVIEKNNENIKVLDLVLDPALIIRDSCAPISE